MLLSITDLRKAFPGDAGPVPVLQGVTLALEAGTSLALTGESGSGKSTLLHIAAGLEPADSGGVEVCGAELSHLGDRDRAAIRRDRLGIVFQQFNLIPSLSVAGNLAFQARLAGRHDPARLERLTAALGLRDHVGKYPEELSGGQQQRVAIGRALAHEPSLVLADEPTGNLDEETADTVLGLMLDLVRDSGAALLLVTHSGRLAARLDRRAHLSRGRLG